MLPQKLKLLLFSVLCKVNTQSDGLIVFGPSADRTQALSVEDLGPWGDQRTNSAQNGAVSLNGW